jgi:aminocarboxymuconate-semialdehyde decarboxylase
LVPLSGEGQGTSFGAWNLNEVNMNIDVHSHIEIPAVFDMLPGKIRLSAPAPRNIPAKNMEEALEKLNNPEKRITDMEKAGISMTIISCAPGQFLYDLDGKLALSISRKINDEIACIVKKYPSKFLGMAHVPLQDVEASVSELERAVKSLDLRGVHVCSNVVGRYLGDKTFLPFFEKVAELDIPVFIHPANVAGGHRLDAFFFQNLIGNPLDTTITAGSLIFSGIFDRLPGLKIILAHAGGFVPYNIDRWKRGFEMRPECREFIKKSPETYLRNFYYDTISHGPVTMRFLVSRVGADRVVMGTDYPYDMGDLTPVQSIQAANFTESDREKITSKNSIVLYKIT